MTVALVTGASRGIGIAIELARRGFTVGASYRGGERAAANARGRKPLDRVVTWIEEETTV
jgi:NAD(P)-dependent dehydrogenase (short-subunit alcohol dehydrogenase family)